MADQQRSLTKLPKPSMKAEKQMTPKFAQSVKRATANGRKKGR